MHQNIIQIALGFAATCLLTLALFFSDSARVKVAAFVLPPGVHVFNANVIAHDDGTATITGPAKEQE